MNALLQYVLKMQSRDPKARCKTRSSILAVPSLSKIYHPEKCLRLWDAVGNVQRMQVITPGQD
jgi:hypothetical protein